MRKIAVSLSKGGVGKTTTAVNPTCGLASKGKKVLLTDTQAQCRGTNQIRAKMYAKGKYPAKYYI